jgi:hypothetical protein
MQEGDFDGAIEAAKGYEKKYPDSWIKVFGLVSGARMRKYDAMKDKGDKAGMTKLAAEMSQAADEISAKVKAEQAKGKTPPERTKELQRALSTAESNRISLLIADERYAEVLAKLGPDYWKAPPADEALRARMLRALCTAVQKQEFARIKDEKARTDAAAMAALWPSFDAAYQTFKRVLPSIKDPEEQGRTAKSGKTLGLLFQWVAQASDAFKTQKDAPASMSQINLAAKRAMADLIEPTLTANDKPTNILGIAQTLWDIDERGRAVRLYELYQKTVGQNADIQAFVKDPKPALDAVETAIGNRPEVKSAWIELRDLVEDKPGLADLIKQGVAEKDWGEKRVNYVAALLKLREFRP